MKSSALGKILVVILIFSFIGTSFAGVHPFVGVSYAAPLTQTPNTAYTNLTLSGSVNSGNGPSGSITLSSTTNENFKVSSWSLSGTTYTSNTISLGEVYYAGSANTVTLSDFTVALPYDSSAATQALNTITIDYYLGGTQFAQSTWSPSSSVTSSYDNAYWAYFDTSGSTTYSILSTGAYSLTVKVLVTVPSSSYNSPVGGYTTTFVTGTSEVKEFFSSPGVIETPSQNSLSMLSGVQSTSDFFTYAGQSATASWSNPSNAQAYEFTWSDSGTGGTSSTLSSGGYFYSPLSTSAKFTQTGAPHVSSYSISWSVTNVVESSTVTVSNTTGVSYNINENQNWWNSTISASIAKAGLLNGQTVDGKAWNTILSKFTVQHILSVGYGTSPGVDVILVSGSASTTITSPSQYNTVSSTPGTTENSAFSLTLNVGEFINYSPEKFTPNAALSSGSTAKLTFTTAEQVSGEHENIQINWGDGSSTPLSDVTYGAQSQSHTYAALGTYSITVQVTNLPNGNPVSGSQLSLTETTKYTISVSPAFSPSPNTELQTGQDMNLTYTESNIQISQVTAAIAIGSGSYSSISVAQNENTYTVSSSSAGETGLSIKWTLTGGSITTTYEISYSSQLIPTEYSHSVSALFSDNATQSYPIALSNVPQQGQIPITITNSQSNATGVYQQLINFPTATYKNSINANFSDVYFSYANGTTIPSWIQSNASNTYTTTPIWLKLNSIPASSSITVYAHIVPNSVFFGQGWANIGEAPNLSPIYAQNDNGYSVFPSGYYWNFINSLPVGLNTTNSGTYSINNGLYFYTTTSSVDFTFTGNKINSQGNATLYMGITNYNYVSGSGYFGYGWTNPWTEIHDTGSSGSFIAIEQAVIPNQPYWEIYNGIGYANISYAFAVQDFSTSMEFGSLQSSNDTQQYYQQLITISNSTTGHSPSYYGLNSANSNFQITTSSGTPLYTWIQSENQSSLTFWTKTPYSTSGTETLQMEVMPNFENLFSASGYLGEAYSIGHADNGLKVFNFYRSGVNNWANVSFTGGGNWTIVNGILEQTNSTDAGGNQLYPEAYFNDTNYSVTSNFAIGIGFEYSVNAIARVGISTIMTPGTDTSFGAYSFVGQQSSNGAGFLSAVNNNIGWFENNNYQGSVNTEYQMNVNDSGGTWSGNLLKGGISLTSMPPVAYTSANAKGYTYGYVGMVSANISSSALTYAVPANFSYFFIRSYVSMPTASISGSGSVNVANTSQINHPQYTSYAAYGQNLSEGEYTYTIPDYYNSDYCSIFFNSSWTLVQASPQTWSLISSGSQNYVTFKNIQNVGSIQVTFLEPIQIEYPLGTLDISYRSSTPIGNTLGLYIPYDQLDTYINDTATGTRTLEAQNSFQVILGHTYRITTYDAFNQQVYSTTVTPSQGTTQVTGTIDFSSIVFTNLNTTNYVNVQIEANGYTLSLPSDNPGATTLPYYLPSGDYKVTYSYFNRTTQGFIKSNSGTENITGVTSQTFNGETLYSLSNQVQTTQDNLSSLVTNFQFDVFDSNGSLKNVILNFQSNFNVTNGTVNKLENIFTLNSSFRNSTIYSYMASIISTDNFINDTVGNFSLNENTRLSYYFSVMNTSFVNVSVKQNYTNTLINTSSYILTVGAPGVYGSKYVFPVYVTLRNNSELADINITKQAANNLKVTYAYMGSESLNFKISNLSAGFFDLSLNLSKYQVSEMDNGSFISLSSPVISGTVGTIAAGKILGSNLPAAKQTWYEKYLGISSPPPGGIGDLSWFILSVPGILSTGILGAFIVLIYTRNLVHGIRKEKREEEAQQERDEKMDKISKDVEELKRKNADREGS